MRGTNARGRKNVVPNMNWIRMGIGASRTGELMCIGRMHQMNRFWGYIAYNAGGLVDAVVMKSQVGGCLKSLTTLEARE